MQTKKAPAPGGSQVDGRGEGTVTPSISPDFVPVKGKDSDLAEHVRKVADAAASPQEIRREHRSTEALLDLAHPWTEAADRLIVGLLLWPGWLDTCTGIEPGIVGQPYQRRVLRGILERHKKKLPITLPVVRDAFLGDGQGDDDTDRFFERLADAATFATDSATPTAYIPAESEGETLVATCRGLADRANVFRIGERLADRLQQAATTGDSAATALAEARAEIDAMAATVERRQGLRLLDDVELMNLPPADWLVQAVLPAGGLSVLYGPAGSGKSFVALDWSCHIARGMTWQGSQVQARPVVFAGLEGFIGLRNRVAAWKCEHRIAGATGVFFLGQPIRLLNPVDVQALVDAIRAAGLDSKPFIVVDTLSRAFAGGDENSTEDMAAFVAACDRLRIDLGASVLLIHHSGRDGSHERGSTALVGAADAMISCRQDDDVVTLKAEKMKDAEPFDKIILRRAVVELGPTETSCVIREYHRQAGELSTAGQEALDALRQFPDGASSTQWKAASGLPDRTYYYARQQLLRDGLAALKGSRYVAAAAAVQGVQ